MKGSCVPIEWRHWLKWGEYGGRLQIGKRDNKLYVHVSESLQYMK